MNSIAKSVLGDKVKRVDVVALTVSIDYNPGALWDERSAIILASSDFTKIAPELFSAIPSVQTLDVGLLSSFTDIYGNSTEKTATRFTMTRATYKKINWSQFNYRDLGRVLIAPGDAVYIHTALSKAWVSYQAER